MENTKFKQFSSAAPGMISFVIDQSGSMTEHYPEGGSKAVFTHKVVNRTINEIINANMDGERVKDRAFLSLLGCGGNGVTNIRSDKLSEFAKILYVLKAPRKRYLTGMGALWKSPHKIRFILK